MLDWLRGKAKRRSSKATFYKSFYEEEDDEDIKRLQELNKKKTMAFSQMTEMNESITRIYDLRKRISFITRRNKKRKILVVPFSSNENLLSSLLLDANSNADYDCAKSLSEAMGVMAEKSYDMIYLIIDMAKEGHGPCFFSFDHDDDKERRDKNPQFDRFYNEIKPLCPDAEVVAICGTSPDKCPIAKRLYEEKVEQENRKISYQAEAV